MIETERGRAREGKRERKIERPPRIICFHREQRRPVVLSPPPRTCGALSSRSTSSRTGCSSGDGGGDGAFGAAPTSLPGLLLSFNFSFLRPSVMSLLGAYKKKTSYDGYESLQLVDSGGDSFGIGRGSSGSGGGGSALGGSIVATLGPKAAPLREEDCSTMDSSGKSPRRDTGSGYCSCRM